MVFKRKRLIQSEETTGAGMDLLEFMGLFPNEESAINYYLENRYKGLITCPHCGNEEKIYRYKTRLKVFQCYKCDNSFSPFKNTIFWKTRISMVLWFYVIMSFLNDRSGASAKYIQRQINVSYPTAFRMLHQIRIAMSNEEEVKAFSGITEFDETYVGGKPRKINNRDGKPLTEEQKEAQTHRNKRGRGTKKIPVLGGKNRETGEVFAVVMLPNKEGKKLTGKQVIEVIKSRCTVNSTIITDEFRAYNSLNKIGYEHFRVNHSLGQYSAGEGIHTNGIENFWSIFKMGWCGTYKHMSFKYLQRYLNEFTFRQNTRLHPRTFDVVLKRTVINNPNLIEDTLLKVV
jgi:transposase-like protein